MEAVAMAKYQVEHSCGHPETHDLLGKSADRERKIAWLERHPCAACVAAERTGAAQFVLEAQVRRGLPELRGTPKQVAFATEIRQSFLVATDRMDASLVEMVCMTEPERSSHAERALFELDDIRTPILAESDAHVWIERRDEISETAIKRKISAALEVRADKDKSVILDAEFPLSASDQRDVLHAAIAAKRAAVEGARQQEQAKRSAEQAALEAKKKSEVAANWAQKDEIAKLVFAGVGSACSLSVWRNEAGTEKRVYVGDACLYVTGNPRHRPGSLDRAYFANVDSLRAGMELAAKIYRNVRINVSAEGRAQ
jgi:hypothetical protein